MKLVTFLQDGIQKMGGLVDDGIADLRIADPTLPGDMLALIEHDAAAIAAAAASAPRLAIGDVRITAPLIPRKNVIAVGRNYADHAAEFSASGFDASEKAMLPEHPVIFSKSPSSIIGPDEAIVLANDPTNTTDYEGELAVVIGQRCRSVSEEQALDKVFGWTVCNDVTARDLQKRHVQWFVGKSPDTYCPIGPCIVTRDELPDIDDAVVTTTVNGEQRQHFRVGELIFGVERLIAVLSEVMTLEPGDVIATGTGLGVGIGRTPPVYLRAGDVVEVAISGIGTLRNPVQ